MLKTLSKPLIFGGFSNVLFSSSKIRENVICTLKLDKFEIDKDFRGCKLHITVHNPGHVESGFKKMIVNREELGENYIPQEKLTEITEVELFMS